MKMKKSMRTKTRASSSTITIISEISTLILKSTKELKKKEEAPIVQQLRNKEIQWLRLWDTLMGCSNSSSNSRNHSVSLMPNLTRQKHLDNQQMLRIVSSTIIWTLLTYWLDGSNWSTMSSWRGSNWSPTQKTSIQSMRSGCLTFRDEARSHWTIWETYLRMRWARSIWREQEGDLNSVKMNLSPLYNDTLSYKRTTINKIRVICAIQIFVQQ